MKEIRVLHIVPKLDIGGIESMLFNYFTEIKSYNIKWDFVVYGNDIGKIEEEMLKDGCSIFHVPPKKDNLYLFLKKIRKIMIEGKYDIVHAHQNNLCFIPLAIAKYCKIKVRIAHSHTCQNLDNKRSLKEKIYIFLNNYYSTNLAFCGKDAGKWAFGNDMVGTWIKNGLDINKFKFNRKAREELCNLYSIENETIVIGMVCRLSPEKNINFSIDIMQSLIRLNNRKYKLFILGDGPLNHNLKTYADTNQLSNSVFFLGRKDNIHKYYSFFDIFLLPSFFEGSPVSLIEAQCSHLYSIVSNTISNEAFINSNIFSESITEKSMNQWIYRIEQFDKMKEKRFYNEKLDIFNIKFLTEELFKYYTELLKDE